MSATLTRRGTATLTTAAFALTGALLLAPSFMDDAHAAPDPITVSADDAAIELTPLGRHESGVFDESAAEIVAYYAATQQLFVVNAQAGIVQVLDASDPTEPTLVADLDPTGLAAADGSTIPEGATANSISVREDGLLAVAIEADVKTDPGWVAFFDGNELGDEPLGAVRVGALPDMVTFTPDGTRAVVANEGEPDDDFEIDPQGSVSVVDVPADLLAPTQDDVNTADFHAFEEGGDAELHEDVRIFGPEVNTEFPVSANLEPEYAAVSEDSTTAWVSLQEANAFAVVDLDSATVTEILPLGFKDHSLPGNGLDPSDRDDEIAIGSWPVLGIYMPDAIASYTANGETYLVSANEGDAREWGDYVEAARVKDLGDDGLAPVCADSPAAGMLDDDQLGRLTVTTATGLEGDCYGQLYSFGARSFSIWTADGELVFDSGQDFEEITAEAAPDFFNSNHTESNFEGRSDDKGPEPEGIAIGEVDGATYAFIGFERVGGVIVYDITEPTDAQFVTYLNNRDFSVSVEDSDDPESVLSQAGDLGPEGLVFIAAEDSPTGEPLLAVGSEVSGTTTIYSVTSTEVEPSPSPTDPTEPPTTDPTSGPTEPTPTSGPTEPTPTGPTDPSSPPASPTGAPTTEPGVGTLGVAADPTTVAQGGEVTVTITGAAPGEPLEVTLFSTPVGSVTAGADGSATVVVTVPADAELGSHPIVVEGESSGEASVEIEIVAAGGDGSLPSTGANVALLVAAAALAALVGALLVRRARAARA